MTCVSLQRRGRVRIACRSSSVPALAAFGYRQLLVTLPLLQVQVRLARLTQLNTKQVAPGVQFAGVTIVAPDAPVVPPRAVEPPTALPPLAVVALPPVAVVAVPPVGVSVLPPAAVDTFPPDPVWTVVPPVAEVPPEGREPVLSVSLAAQPSAKPRIRPVVM